MERPKSFITDSGLARRLGEELDLNKGKDYYHGNLVYYPDRFGVLSDEGLTNIENGDIIIVRVNSLLKKTTYCTKYVYIKPNRESLD